MMGAHIRRTGTRIGRKVFGALAAPPSPQRLGAIRQRYSQASVAAASAVISAAS